MPDPGFYARQAQQAARAGAEASRRASQYAEDAGRAARARRARQGYPPRRAHPLVRLIRGLFVAAFMVVFLAVGAFIVLSVLHRAAP
jgi:hypothetical protein